jgi:serine/threonine-protein kinase
LRRAFSRDIGVAERSRLELGRYRLDEQVGQGGMAVVWRGWDTQLRRTVAVKVLHAHLHAREDIRRRFDREAHAVARLHHPFILEVYDFSGPLGQPSYLVTEFIRGQTLRAFAEAHPFDPPELAAACLLPIAEALQHAHAAGVVHRDLKPENIMVRDDGVVKLTDFGIAALLDPDEKFTITGSILGSPAHLAPETIEGKPADPRSDLYSFGTILYWLSCGNLPYQAGSPAALLRSILEGKRQDPRMVRPAISDGQARIIARCMENDPAARYQSAAELRHELEELLREAGLADPLRQVAEFVKAPEQHGPRVRDLVVARSLAAGEEQLRLGKTSAALAAFGRALALDQQNAQAKGRVERIRRRERLFKLGWRAALLLLVLALFSLVSWQVRTVVQSRRARAVAERAAQEKLEETRKAAAKARADRLAREKAAADVAARAKAAQRAANEEAARRTAAASKANAVKPEPLDVKLHAKYYARVSVDGRDLGESNMFALKLSPGTHQVLVHHPCCSDKSQEVRITPSRPIYPLEYGPAQPARFKVLNAPSSDAKVYIDGHLVGIASDLPDHAMKEPVQKATVIIGDRTLTTTLKAGFLNTLDYAKGAP